MADSARTTTRLLTALTAVVLTVACGDDDGNGSEISTPSDVPINAGLEVHYEHPEADVDKTYTITCTDSSAEISGDDVDVDAEAACAALEDERVIERLVDGPQDADVCTEIYGGPDTAHLEGAIGNRVVSADADRRDGCAIDDWDNVLGPLLPPAIGVQAPTASG